MDLLTGDNRSMKVSHCFFAVEQGVAVVTRETQRVTAEGKRHTDFTDTAVDLACSRAFLLYVYSDIGYNGCSRHWSLRALARLMSIPVIGC